MRKSDWTSALKHLQRDPVLREIVGRVGPCRLDRHRDPFLLLCRAIYSQQISSKVAAVLFERFSASFPRRRPTPKLVMELLEKDVELPGLGLSKQKRKYLLDLARHFVTEQFPRRRLHRMNDEEIIEALTAVNGIGRWTAEMFLMFALNRPDVLPVDDLGLRSAVQSAWKLPARPTAAELKALAEPWRPFRSIATWYLWRSTETTDGGWTVKKAKAARKRRRK